MDSSLWIRKNRISGAFQKLVTIKDLQKRERGSISVPVTSSENITFLSVA